MSESNSEAGLDQDQVKDAPQGRGILLGFCYHPNQDNQDEYLVFRTLDMKGQLVPVIRHGIRTGNDILILYPNMNKKIEFSRTTFEKHLLVFNRDIRSITEYCRICISSIDQGKPLSSFEAVDQAKVAMAVKKLDEMGLHTDPVEDGQACVKELEDIKGHAPRAAK